MRIRAETDPRQQLRGARWLVALLLPSACLSGPGAAALNTAVAVGYTANERAHGRGCWAACPTGTTCDEESGMCEPIPCGGCPAAMLCQESPTGSKCVHPGQESEIVLTWTLADAEPADAAAGDAGIFDAGAKKGADARTR
jgi:hypothetical protein